MKNYLPSIVILILIFKLGILSAQLDQGTLKINEKVSKEIQASESHQFTMDLKKDQFVLLELLQHGIDLEIITFNPAGDEIEKFDSPNGKNGPELITIISKSAGKYKLEVKPLDESQDTGMYDLEVRKLEALAVTKPGQVDQLFAVWDNNKTPGAAISIVEDGEIVHTNGYGMASLVWMMMSESISRKCPILERPLP